MKLIKDKELLKNIAQQINILNTLGGGISQTRVKISKLKKGMIIRVHTPSVSPEAYQVLLQQNKLTILALHTSEEDPELQAPVFHQEIVLPVITDLHNIQAQIKDNMLEIRLPYLDKTIRNIDITFPDTDFE